jgi:hypothetical protein
MGSGNVGSTVELVRASWLHPENWCSTLPVIWLIVCDSIASVLTDRNEFKVVRPDQSAGCKSRSGTWELPAVRPREILGRAEYNTQRMNPAGAGSTPRTAEMGPSHAIIHKKAGRMAGRRFDAT